MSLCASVNASATAQAEASNNDGKGARRHDSRVEEEEADLVVRHESSSFERETSAVEKFLPLSLPGSHNSL